MAEIVEFCGAPGAGKSTLYNELVLKWEEAYGWVPGSQLYPVLEKSSTGIRRAVNLVAGRAEKTTDNAAIAEAGRRFLEENKEFVDCCWRNVCQKQKHSFNGKDNRLRAAGIWMQVFQKLQVIKESRSNKLAIVDEGLIQRIDSALYKSNDIFQEQKEIAQLLEIMMLPAAVVFVDANADLAIARMKAREKKLPIFNGLSSSDLSTIYQNYRQRWMYVFSLLEDKGIPVLLVDASKNIQDNLRQIVKFLQELETKKSSTRLSLVN